MLFTITIINSLHVLYTFTITIINSLYALLLLQIKHALLKYTSSIYKL